MNQLKKPQQPKRLTDNEGDEKHAKPGKRAKVSLYAWSQTTPLPKGEIIYTLKNFVERIFP